MIVQITSRQKYDGLSMEILPEDLNLSLPVRSFIRFHKIFVLKKKLIKGVVSRLKPSAYDGLIQNIHATIK